MYELSLVYNRNGDIITTKDILNCLETACYNAGFDNGLNDLRDKCTSAQFGVILESVGKMLNELKVLWLNPLNKSAGLNPDFINALTDLYIDISLFYDKRIEYKKLCSFIGVSCSYIYDTNKRNRLNNNISQETLNSYQTFIQKRLKSADNRQQMDKARDSKQAILNLAYNNYEHNWAGQIKAQETAETIRTLNDISGRVNTISCGTTSKDALTDISETQETL
mgnify:CR=1 FL=1